MFSEKVCHSLAGSFTSMCGVINGHTQGTKVVQRCQGCNDCFCDLSLRYLGEGDGFKRVEYRLEFLDRCFPLTENRTQWPVSKAVPSLAKTQRITFSLGVLMNDLAREFSSSSIWPYCDGLITPDSGVYPAWYFAHTDSESPPRFIFLSVRFMWLFRPSPRFIGPLIKHLVHLLFR